MLYVYSCHLHKWEARGALCDYLALGIVSEAENPRIARRGKFWCVLFNG